MYLVLQLNDSEDAERMANIFGTFETVETTYKSIGNSLDKSGAGSKRIVHEYKVSPDMIKELKSLTAIYYSKASPQEIQIISVPFVQTT